MPKKDSIRINSGGGPVFLDKVDNTRGKITGRSDHKGINIDEVTKLFEDLFVKINQHTDLSGADKADLKAELEELRRELNKTEAADEGFLMRTLRNIGRMAPDILEVTLAAITNPIAGFGIIAKKVAEKVKASAE